MEINTNTPIPVFQNPIPVIPLTRSSRIARAISRWFSPPLMAAAATFLAAAESHTRAAWFWAFFIIIFSVLVPCIYILKLLKMGRVTDFDVYLREQRFGPYVIGLVCSGLSWLIMAIFHAPRIMVVMTGTAVGEGVIMFVINTRWKISAHAASTACVSTIMWRLLGPVGILALLTIPLVSWSRVRLGRHTVRQVIAGSFVGLFFTALVFIIWL